MNKHTEIVSLDEIPLYSKMQLAEHQLERAVILYLDEKDYISSITLAGASEEILGRLLENKGETNDLNELVIAFASEYGVGWEELRKWVIEDENYYRNHLKHIKDGSYISIYPEAAQRKINSALANFIKLNGKQSENMKRYFDMTVL